MTSGAARLASPKGCFTAYYIRSIDELSGRTKGQLGDIRPDTPNSIGGTAKLALLYSTNLCILIQTQALLSDDYRQVWAGALAVQQHLQGQQDRLWDYAQTGSSGRRCRLRRGRSSFQRNYEPDGSAGGLCQGTPQQEDN